MEMAMNYVESGDVMQSGATLAILSLLLSLNIFLYSSIYTVSIPLTLTSGRLVSQIAVTYRVEDSFFCWALSKNWFLCLAFCTQLFIPDNLEPL